MKMLDLLETRFCRNSMAIPVIPYPCWISNSPSYCHAHEHRCAKSKSPRRVYCRKDIIGPEVVKSKTNLNRNGFQENVGTWHECINSIIIPEHYHNTEYCQRTSESMNQYEVDLFDNLWQRKYYASRSFGTKDMFGQKPSCQTPTEKWAYPWCAASLRRLLSRGCI